MPALDNKHIADIPHTPKVLYSTNIATLTPIIFITPPPGLTLIKYIQKAISEFNVVLNSYLNKYY